MSAMKALVKKYFHQFFYGLIITGLAFSEPCLAQTPPVNPGGHIPLLKPPPAYPGAEWPFSIDKATPTVDQNGAYYLPYLPWIGENLAKLVDYSSLFYQMQKDSSGNGSNTPYDNIGTTLANNFLSQQQELNMTAAATQTQQNIQQFLSFDPAHTIFFSLLPAVPGTDIIAPCDGKSCPDLPTDAPFNADSLFGITGFQPGTSDKPSAQREAINQLILFLTAITQPLPNPGLSPDPKIRKQELNNSLVQSYILKVRTMAALQSMALSNFNYLAKEREIIPGLGKSAGMMTIPPAGSDKKVEPIDDASQLQLDKYLLDRRLNNPEWYSHINAASPEAVQRETLYVLVEIQRQLYETQMLNERTLATLSTMQMGMAQIGFRGLGSEANIVQGCLKDPKNCSPTG